jgi:hypothetical protein
MKLCTLFAFHQLNQFLLTFGTVVLQDWNYHGFSCTVLDNIHVQHQFRVGSSLD